MNINNVINSFEQPLTFKNEKKQVGDFGSFMKESIQKVNELQLESEKQDSLFAVGQVDNIHEVMIAAQKAEIALQFTLEIKNKILDAYREIMRLQV